MAMSRMGCRNLGDDQEALFLTAIGLIADRFGFQLKIEESGDGNFIKFDGPKDKEQALSIAIAEELGPRFNCLH